MPKFEYFMQNQRKIESKLCNFPKLFNTLQWKINLAVVVKKN